MRLLVVVCGVVSPESCESTTPVVCVCSYVLYAWGIFEPVGYWGARCVERS